MNRFFKKFKKIVKNARQDRIYKDGKKLPDSPENLKTYGIPLYGYGIPIEEVKKTIKDLNQENKSSKSRSKKTKTKSQIEKEKIAKEYKKFRLKKKAKIKKEVAYQNIKNNAYSKALKNINESIELNDSDFEAFLCRASVKILLKDFEEVMDDYKQAEKLGASNLELISLKIDLTLANEETYEAIENLTQYIEVYDSSSYSVTHAFLSPHRRYLSSYFFRANCYEKIGNYEYAIDDLTSFIDIAKDDFTLEESTYLLNKQKSEILYESYIKIAELNYKLEKYNDSIAAYNCLLAIVKDLNQISFLRSEIAKISKNLLNYGESIFQYSKLIEAIPYENNFYHERAKIKKIVNDEDGYKKDTKIARLLKKTFKTYDVENWGRYKDIDLLNQLIQIDPINKIFYRLRASFFNEIDDKKLAILDFTKLISLEPNNPNNYEYRGRLSLKIEDLKSALGDFSKAIELNPNDQILYILRANTLKGLKNYDAAIEDWKHIENSSDNKTQFLSYLGIAEAETKKNLNEKNIKFFSKALDYCEKLNDLNPESSISYAIRCFIFVKCDIPLNDFKEDIKLVMHFDPECASLSRYLNLDEINKLIDFYNHLGYEELERQEKKKEEEMMELMAEIIVKMDKERRRQEVSDSLSRAIIDGLTMPFLFF